MNRIVLDRSSDEFNVNNDEMIININHDINYLINNNDINSYVFNISNANVNVLATFHNHDDVSFIFNIDNGSLSFNNIMYKSNDEHVTVNLNKEHDSVHVYNSVISRTDEKVFIKVFHNAKKTTSNVYNCGTTKDDGSICFDTISSVKKGTKNCILNQDSKIISLNDNNMNKINPVLLIDEYDTEARHSAFIGKFNKDEIFYLMSRGLSEKDANKLLLEGFLVGIMDISDEEKDILKDKINNEWR